MLVSLRRGPGRGPVRSCVGHHLPGRGTDTWSRFENLLGSRRIVTSTKLTRSHPPLSLGLIFIGWKLFQRDGDGLIAGARARSGSTSSQAAAPSTDKPAATKKEVVQPNRAAIAGVSEAVRAPPN